MGLWQLGRTPEILTNPTPDAQIRGRLAHWLIGLLLIGASVAMPVRAQNAPIRLGLPFLTPPGPNTWLLDQHYGNTVEAYTFGKYWYASGQGLHFGVDFEARCGTPVHAIADGEVLSIVEGEYGAGPFNLTIRHKAVGILATYSHLLERPILRFGQAVRQGEVIGKVGDPDLSCTSRPHLHLELHDLTDNRALNPVDYFDIDWDRLALLSRPIGVRFARNLSAPDRWQTIRDQPAIRMGGGILNGFTDTWPPSARLQPPFQAAPSYTAADVILPIVLPANPYLLRLTELGCCIGPWWSPDSKAVHYLAVAEGEQTDRAMVHTIRLDVETTTPPDPELSLFSADGAYRIRREESRYTVTRLSDGKSWPANTRGSWPAISPGNRWLLWQVRYGEDLPGYPFPQSEIRIAPLEGGDDRLIRTQVGGYAGWLDDDRILLVTPVGPRTQSARLEVYTISSGQFYTLVILDFLRNLSIAPGGKHLMLFLPFQDNPAQSGIYSLETRQGATPQKLPFLGGWRWRDSQSVIYVPFSAPGRAMALSIYDIVRGESLPLAAPPLIIANADWQIAPDGQHMLFVEARDNAIWLLRLARLASPKVAPTATPGDSEVF